MTDRIRVADYHSQPILELELPDGSVWKLRQPLEADYYRTQEIITKWQKAVNEYGHLLKVRAEERREAEEQRIAAVEQAALWRLEEHRRLQPDTPPEELEAAVEKAVKKRIADAGDQVARALIEEESDEERLPLNLTVRYLWASIVSVFLEPVQTPETILEALGPDIIHELHGRIQAVLGGDAAKKRLARET